MKRMIDTSKAKWEFSKEDKYIFDWLKKNGFDAALEKQYISKMKVTVSKNGITDNAEFISGTKFDVKSYMEQYRKSFDLLCELKKLRDMRKEDEGK
jgi:hypothetical protein